MYGNLNLFSRLIVAGYIYIYIYIFVVIVYFRVNIDLVNCTTVIHCILLVIRAIHHRPVNTL